MFDWKQNLSIIILMLFIINIHRINGKPTANAAKTNQTTDPNNSTNKDLYLIRQTVYEVGILVDANDTACNSSESDSGSSELVDDQVQLTLFGSNHNGTLEFDEILPVQVNSSGYVMTKEPIKIGQITNLTALTESLPFNGTIVNATKAQGTFLVLD